MDNNAMVAVATLAPKFPKLSAIISGITWIHDQVRADVLKALATGEPIRQTRPYTTGELESGIWFVVAVPVDGYRRLSLTITCKDDVLREMLKAALADGFEPVYLDPQDMADDGADVLCCTIAGARDDHAQAYAARFAVTA